MKLKNEKAKEGFKRLVKMRNESEKRSKGKLTTKSRNKLKSSTFGLPGERKYPMPDRSHAANAKARATQQVNKGNLSPAQKRKIDAKANKILGKKSSNSDNINNYMSKM